MNIRGGLTAAALAASLLAAVTPGAVAYATAPVSTADCAAPTLFNALSGFGDARHYFVAPGGDFNGGSTAWDLQGRATLTSDHSPFDLARNSGSLSLPAGATATSPAFCVDLDYPTFRFFAAQTGTTKSVLKVDVIYPAINQKKTEAASVDKLGQSWALTKDVPLKPAVVDKAAGWRVVKIRFRSLAAGAADVRVDDVLVDPRMRG